MLQSPIQLRLMPNPQQEWPLKEAWFNARLGAGTKLLGATGAATHLKDSGHAESRSLVNLKLTKPGFFKQYSLQSATTNIKGPHNVAGYFSNRSAALRR